jgi:hypothetical protein
MNNVFLIAFEKGRYFFQNIGYCSGDSLFIKVLDTGLMKIVAGIMRTMCTFTNGNILFKDGQFLWLLWRSDKDQNIFPTCVDISGHDIRDVFIS